MKTIFRSLNMGIILASIIVLGAVAGFAQDPCTDAEGQNAANDKIQTLFKDKSITGRKAYVEAGKAFLEKYGTCATAKELADYLTPQLPKIEEIIKNMEGAKAKGALTARFDTGLKTKNWDEVYASGKEILQKYPDEFRTAELVLGSIGLDETAKTPPQTKWNEDTLRFAKASIADLESGKEFKTFGVAPFTYKNKEDALGWMNYTIGYIYYFDKKNKKEGLSYIYKASQLNSDTRTNPIVFQLIGSYYFDEVKKLAAEVDALAKGQDAKDTEEIAKQKVDFLKAKVALVNGTAEAAIDAYARSYKLAKADPVKYKKEYTDGLLKSMQDLYNVRFGKMAGFDVFIANTVTKPMPNPLNPVTPIKDPEPAAVTVPVTAPATTPATTIKPATTPVKPPVTTPVKPPVKKPVTKQAVVKKPVVKKKKA